MVLRNLRNVSNNISVVAEGKVSVFTAKAEVVRGALDLPSEAFLGDS